MGLSIVDGYGSIKNFLTSTIGAYQVRNTVVVNDEGENVNNTFVADETNLVVEFLTSDGTTYNQKVDGSTTPVRFSSTPVPVGKIFLCARVILYMEDGTAFSSTTFAGIAALVNGWELEINGTVALNVKNNKDLASMMFDFTGNELFGKVNQVALGRFSLDKITGDAKGATIREGETITAIVNDNFLELQHLQVIVEGVYKDA